MSNPSPAKEWPVSMQKESTVVNLLPVTSASKILPHTKEAGDPYYDGDVYDAVPLAISKEWEINMVDYPYLQFIKSISTAWPHLRYLADFMEVSTIPLKWEVIRNNKAERQDRAQRTNISILDSSYTGTTLYKNRVTKWDELKMSLEVRLVENTALRLILVEDLSRQVIEILGAKFDIDPNFFRDHIDDYSWYNIRDRWMVPTNLTASVWRQKWIRVRFVRPRYFRTKELLQKAREESARFNIYRRPEDDLNQWPEIDGEGVVGLTRTKVSMWVDHSSSENSQTIGVILVDPTVKEGYPMWYGYRNWAPTPSFHNRLKPPPHGPPRTSLFEDLDYWIRNNSQFSSSENSSYGVPAIIALEPMISLICGEWLIICEYIKTRLGQIEWRLNYPNEFRVDSDLVHLSLSRVHMWQRLIPLYREMVSEALSSTVTLVSAVNTGISNGDKNSVSSVTVDLEEVLKKLTELERRNEKIMGAIATVISIEDTRIGLRDNKNMGRLTWLATIFLPLTYVTGLFSMQTDITALRTTFYWYFGIAIPVTLAALLVAVYLNRYSERAKRTLPRMENFSIKKNN
ncbi:hypothetical protein FHL15_011046 [Xylaria flabelliformis]|uniref:Uncharacterized protein n=1 Tax=Xylaria flabelliformis TaxID=2512241 RepID=A0A553HJC6_9PEZI|nr:hypothetical protein FHL15_011046 [Xylaria flabelliformis]